MSSLALYRTYRPGRFADVVGQEHVTGPLTRALANDRVHHAYLFSGPRGCGKTSSARILARSLNCEKGPTPEPCGECRSCRDLAPNGPGSIDVVELDAATHGLVDDARELREKAHFAPVSSRFKIYIIDEAHQLGPGAANALLKLIEEPPPHLKFVFATTAPDKIIGTIRSRTHHYPFRLIPARTLQQNLASIAEKEGVPIEPAALTLVARGAAGSARDAQSLLGQLIAGSDERGVTYDQAIGLLGFTDAALLDEVVDAIAVGDGAAVFTGIDRVMDSGHDPRRFLTDLLERFRDLVVIKSVPDAVSSGLIETPDEEAERMAAQAARFGSHDLVRLADVVDEGITAMKGATPTRLQLEMVCARLLLPGADDTASGVQARLDRLERRLALGGSPAAPAAAQPPAAPVPAQPQAPPERGEAPQPRPATPEVRATPAEGTSAPPQESAAQPPPVPQPPAAAPPAQPAPASQPSSPGSTASEVRRLWPEVLVRLREIKRTPWSLISQESSVVDVADGVLTLAFRQPTLRDTFVRREDFQENLRQAISDVLGVDLKIEAIVDPGAQGGSASGGRPANPGPNPGAGQSPGGGGAAPANSPGDNAGRPGATANPADGHAASAQPANAASSARAAVRAKVKVPQEQSRRQTDGDDHGADPGDQDLDDSGLSGRELVERTLGATVIEEIDHN